MKKYLISAMMILGLSLQAGAQAPQPQPLYPNGAPDSNGLTKADEILADGRLTNGSEADYYLFLPDKAKATGQAVVVLPGGGYALVAYDHEGLQVARWLNAHGIAAIVVRYRMPNKHHEIPLRDVHQAIRTVRSNAAKWNIDPNDVGIMGFSAGGHLASTAATKFDAATRPDFAVLFYPVITLGPPSAHTGSRTNLIGTDASPEMIRRYSSEQQVSNRTPRTFLALSDDDKTVPPVNSTLFYDALKAYGIPAELHIYPTGGHGWGWREDFKYKDEVRTALLRWLQEK